MGAKHKKDYFTESRKQYDALVRDFDSVQKKTYTQMAYDMGYDKTMQEEARRLRAKEAQMAIRPGEWKFHNTDSSSMSMSRKEYERMGSKFWSREYNCNTDQQEWRLDTRMVADEMRRIPPKVFHAIRDDERKFDQHFGMGAFRKVYGIMRNDPRNTPDDMVDAMRFSDGRPKEARSAKHVTQLVRPKINKHPVKPFKIDADRSVLQQLRVDHEKYMSSGDDAVFHVKHKETALEALQRLYNNWHGLLNIRAAKPGEFTVTSGTTLTFVTSGTS